MEELLENSFLLRRCQERCISVTAWTWLRIAVSRLVSLFVVKNTIPSKYPGFQKSSGLEKDISLIQK